MYYKVTFINKAGVLRLDNYYKRLNDAKYRANRHKRYGMTDVRVVEVEEVPPNTDVVMSIEGTRMALPI